MQRQHRLRAAAGNAPSDLFATTKQRPCPPCVARPRAQSSDRLRQSVTLNQRNAPPHSISDVAADIGLRCGRTHRRAPQRVTPDRRRTHVAARARRARMRVCVARQRFATDASRRTRDGALGTGQAYRSAIAVPAVADSGNGMRAPFVETAQRFVGGRAPARSSAPICGRGRHLIDTSRITPSVPSDPAMSRETSKPATFFMTRPPNDRSSPRPSSRRTPSTTSRTAPA